MTHSPTQFMQTYERATNSQDLQAILPLIDDDAVYLFSDQSVHRGKEAIARAIGRNFSLIQDETYTIDNLTWLAQSDTVAACVYDYTWSGLIDGKPASGHGRGTTVLHRTTGPWRVIHEHLSKGPFTT